MEGPRGLNAESQAGVSMVTCTESVRTPRSGVPSPGTSMHSDSVARSLFAALAILLAASVLSAGTLSADTLWTKTLGGAGYDCGNSIEPTSDGGYIICGVNGQPDACLIKTDRAGNLMWQRAFSRGDNAECGNAAVQTSDGGYIMVGSTNSAGPGRGSGAYAVYLVKTDADGHRLWDRCYGGRNDDLGNSVQQTSDGGYIICGSTQSFGSSRKDAYLVKTDASGALVWQKCLGGGWDEAHFVQQTTDGGYVLVGESGNYTRDVYLIKTDAGGDVVWKKAYAQDYEAYGSSVQQTSDGGYVLVGGNGMIGTRTVFLAKTDLSGDLLWKKTASGSYYYNSVRQTSDGGYIVAGRDDRGAFLMKTDTSGTTVWQKSFGRGNARAVREVGPELYVFTGPSGSYSDETNDIWLVMASWVGANAQGETPYLEVSAVFDDTKTGGNKKLDAGEEANVVLAISNSGSGCAFGVRLTPMADDPEITLPRLVDLGTVPAGRNRVARIPISASADARSDTASMTVETKEWFGFDAQSVKLTIPVLHVEPPKLEVRQPATIADEPPGNANGVAENGETVEVGVAVANTGLGRAYGVKTSLASLQPGIGVTARKDTIGDLAPGDTKSGRYSVSIPRSFVGDSLRFSARATDTRSSVQPAEATLVLPYHQRCPDFTLTHEVHDGDAPDSRGNRDGVVQAGEIIELLVTLTNRGETRADSVTLTLSTDKAGVVFNRSTARLKRIPSGGAETVGFLFTLQQSVAPGNLPLTLAISPTDFPMNEHGIGLEVVERR